MRILYVHSTLQPPPTDVRTDRFWLLSERLEGDVLQPIWFQSGEAVEAMFGPGSFPVYTVGRFRYQWFPGSNRRGLWQKLATFRFYLRKGRELHRERPFDCIVAYSHMTTGLLAVALKLLTGAKLIVELVTSPDLVYITNRARPTLVERFMKLYSDLCLHVTMLLSDRVHLLYPTQLSHYPLLRGTRSSVFHEFVPVSRIERDADREHHERYVLLVGAPWYLKGADVLIKAFLALAPEFPDVKLKMLGHYPDYDSLAALTGGSPRIEIMPARPNVEALKIIAGATVIVQPSRCEGMGRVLLEGMAAGVPLIGSDVGGIPTLVHDGENGFLCPVGDVESVTPRLRQLLSDPQLNRRMGDAGYTRAHAELNEEDYVRAFAKMVEETVHGDPATPR